jgi:predicted ATP-grasp superfamily ATP-dependent carboligase
LFGYVGVDLIATDSCPVVLEINPRLTTSYVALKDALGANPAAQVLALAAGGDLPSAAPARALALALALALA